MTKDNHKLTLVWVGDDSGSIHLSLFDELGDVVQPADILHLIGGCVSVNECPLPPIISPPSTCSSLIFLFCPVIVQCIMILSRFTLVKLASWKRLESKCVQILRVGYIFIWASIPIVYAVQKIYAIEGQLFPLILMI